jgi:uncharacterized protein
MKRSRYLHEFPLDQTSIALYHSLNLKLVFIRKDVWTAVIDLATHKSVTSSPLANSTHDEANQAIAVLTANGMFVSDAFDELDMLSKVSQTLTGRPRIEILYLVLTKACNFACKYCYIRTDDQKSMSPALAMSAIDSFLDISRGRNRLIIFYGGEPLLHFDVIQQAVAHTKRSLRFHQHALDNITFQIITNGSMVTSQIAAYIANEGISVTVSLDGDEHTNNECRIYPSGQGTYRDTVEGINMLRKASANLSISCTVGNHNASRLDSTMMWFSETLGIRNIGFNMIQGLPRENRQSCSDATPKTVSSIINCFELARDNHIHEQRIMRMVNAFVNARVYPFDCAGCGRLVVVTPNGKYGPCPGFMSEAVYFDDLPIRDLEDSATFLTWSKRSPLNMPQCASCFALGLCGGGCPYQAFIDRGSIWELDARHCTYARDVLLWLIHDTYRHIGRP